MTENQREVRYERLRPAQIVAARQACPVVYIPIGTLEWHGVHNPVGADTLQADGIWRSCAHNRAVGWSFRRSTTARTGWRR